MQRYRHSWFLLSLIALIALAPVTERMGIAAIAYQILFTIVVLLALNATTDRRRHLAAAAACAISWLILDWAGFLLGFRSSAYRRGSYCSACCSWCSTTS